MTEYVTAIRTESGDKQIDYNALANLPQPDKTLSTPGKFADAQATGAAISNLKDDVNAMLTLKADKEYVDSLNAADITYVNEQLTLKADKTYVDSLNAANATDVEQQLALKADITYVNSVSEEDTNYVNEQLALKADKEYVEAMLTVPASSSDDNGKFLRVVDGVATWQIVPNAEESGF